jgi:hypothetical protein
MTVDQELKERSHRGTSDRQVLGGEKHLTWAVIWMVLITSAIFSVARAQAPRIKVALESEENVSVPEGTVQRILVERDKQMISGHLLRRDDKLLLAVPDQPQVELPRVLETMISKDGKTILQFGDEIKLTHPRRTDLYWVDQSGKVVHQLVNHYAGNAVIAMSDDGFTVVAGKLFDKPDDAVVALYSPVGRELWVVRLEEDRRVAQIVVTPKGQHAVAIVTDSQDWMQNHRVQIRHKNGEISAIVPDMGVLQKLVLLDDGSKAFIQGYDSYGMLDIPTGRLIWQRQEKVRMISPYGAGLSPDGTILFLLIADLKDKAEETYGWELVALNASAGERLLQEHLPKKYPSTWERVFEQISEDGIRILAGQQRVRYSWKRM